MKDSKTLNPEAVPLKQYGHADDHRHLPALIAALRPALVEAESKIATI